MACSTFVWPRSASPDARSLDQWRRRVRLQRSTNSHGRFGIRLRGYWRWIESPRLERSRRFTPLWICTTAKVRLAVIPLSSCYWSVRDTLRSKHTQEVRKVETETTTALTAFGHSPHQGEYRREPVKRG